MTPAQNGSTPIWDILTSFLNSGKEVDNMPSSIFIYVIGSEWECLNAAFEPV